MRSAATCLRMALAGSTCLRRGIAAASLTLECHRRFSVRPPARVRTQRGIAKRFRITEPRHRRGFRLRKSAEPVMTVIGLTPVRRPGRPGLQRAHPVVDDAGESVFRDQGGCARLDATAPKASRSRAPRFRITRTGSPDARLGSPVPAGRSPVPLVTRDQGES